MDTTERGKLVARAGQIDALGFVTGVSALVVPIALLIIFGRQVGGVALGVFVGLLLTTGVLLVRSIDIDDQIHELNLILEHIHTPGCSSIGEVRLLERKTHRVHDYGPSNPWAGNVPTTVVDYERMQCSECGSITVWPRGGPPRLETH